MRVVCACGIWADTPALGWLTACAVPACKYSFVLYLIIGSCVFFFLCDVCAVHACCVCMWNLDSALMVGACAVLLGWP